MVNRIKSQKEWPGAKITEAADSADKAFQGMLSVCGQKAETLSKRADDCLSRDSITTLALMENLSNKVEDGATILNLLRLRKNGDGSFGAEVGRILKSQADFIRKCHNGIVKSCALIVESSARIELREGRFPMKASNGLADSVGEYERVIRSTARRFSRDEDLDEFISGMFLHAGQTNLLFLYVQEKSEKLNQLDLTGLARSN